MIGSIQEVTFKPHLEVSGEGIPGITKCHKGDSMHSLNVGRQERGLGVRGSEEGHSFNVELGALLQGCLRAGLLKETQEEQVKKILTP